MQLEDDNKYGIVTLWSSYNSLSYVFRDLNVYSNELLTLITLIREADERWKTWATISNKYILSVKKNLI